MGKIIINVTDRKNKKHILEAKKGQTLMQLIDQNELANPYGICGGEPMCGTCHVYVEKEWLDKPRGRDRQELLDPNNEPPGYLSRRPWPTVYNEILEFEATNVILRTDNP